MKHVLRLLFCLALIVVVCRINTQALRVPGSSGSIDFSGTGTITHMLSPPQFDVYGGNCTPSDTVECLDPIDTSLSGSGIVRAEYLRVSVDRLSDFLLTFGCSDCPSVSVKRFDLVNGGLSTETTAALQALIDQYGPQAIHMAFRLEAPNTGGSGSLEISSIAGAIDLDLKSDGLPNTFNPKSRGVTPIAILTSPSFDATTIDVSTLKFGVTGHETAPKHSVLEDADEDGDIDLVVFFRNVNTGIECETLFAYVTGETLTGKLIAGIDSLGTVSCR